MIPGVTAGGSAFRRIGQIQGYLPGVALQESYSRQLTAVDATAWSISSGALPAGLSLNAATGEISGVVPSGTTEGNYTFQVMATGDGYPSTRSFTIGVGHYITLLHGNGTNGGTTFTDETGKAWTPTGNVQTSTDGAALGGTSMLFDGSGDYLTTPDHADWALGLADFTMEAFITLGANVTAGTFPSIMGQRQNVGSQHSWTWSLTPTPEQNETSIVCNNNAAFAVSESALVVATRTHVAVSRRGTRLYFHHNGVLTNALDFNQNILDSSQVMRIGAFDAPAWSGSYFNGRLNELRVTVGAARYAEGDTFDPAEIVELSDYPQ